MKVVAASGGLLAFSQPWASSLQHVFYHSDGGGSVTALLSTNQSVVGRYLYDPYGNVLAKHGLLGDANLYRYSSKEAHERSGLVYFGLRYYSPTLQRWLNEDPAGEAGGVNLFVFAGNSPPNRLDPWGLWWDAAAHAAYLVYETTASKEPIQMDKVVVKESNFPTPASGSHPGLDHLGALLGSPSGNRTGERPEGESGKKGETKKGAQQTESCLGVRDPKTGVVTPVRTADGSLVLYPPTADISANIRWTLTMTGGRGSLPEGEWLTTMVQKGSHWDYKRLDPRYEPFGNFHYGVVASAAGFTRNRVLREAGRNQREELLRQGLPETETEGDPGWKYLPDWEMFDSRGTPPYRDYRKDQALIKMGIDAYAIFNYEYVRIPCK